MLQFICMFVPAFVMLGITQKIENKKYQAGELIIKYFSFLAIITLINLFFLKFLGNGDYIMNNESFTNSFALKYMVSSIGIALLISIPYEIIKRNIDLKIDYVIEKRALPETTNTEGNIYEKK